MHNESIAKTLGVAIGVCVVCSVLVSSAAVLLKPYQDANKAREKMENILTAAGFTDEQLSVNNEALKKLFDENIDVEVVDLEMGLLLTDADPSKIDERQEVKDPDQSRAISAEEDLAGIKRAPNRQRIYLYRDNGRIKRIILPVHGKGLWSTMYGYLTLGPDLRTVEQMNFYEHGETPGLGAEISDNASWRDGWVGKYAFGPDGEPRIEVIKGKVKKGSPNEPYEVDGISGATITCRGVTHLLHYWLGKSAYGPVLDELRKNEEARP